MHARSLRGAVLSPLPRRVDPSNQPRHHNTLFGQIRGGGHAYGVQATTVADPAATMPADLVGRDFSTAPEAVNTRWCGDITYINTWQGWLYLATVIDLASRKVVGWAVATGSAGASPAHARRRAWRPLTAPLRLGRPECGSSWRTARGSRR